MHDVSVLVPYRPDDGYRQRAWESVVKPAWWASGAELLVESPASGAHPGEFNHPAAINQAAARASGDVLIIADADTYWAPTTLPERLVEAVRSGAPWAMARRYAKLSAKGSRSLVTGAPKLSYEGLVKDAWIGDSICWSGLVCVRADHFAAVGGYDERWEFWGSDDVAFGLTMDTLIGRHERIAGSCLHLWHPAPLAQTYGHERHPAQHALAEDYKMAADDPVAMRRVRFAEPRIAALA